MARPKAKNLRRKFLSLSQGMESKCTPAILSRIAEKSRRSSLKFQTWLTKRTQNCNFLNYKHENNLLLSLVFTSVAKKCTLP